MSQRHARDDRSGGPPRLRLLLPFAGAGLFLACTVVLLLGGKRETHTVSSVERRIREVAMAGQRESTIEAGLLGPWKIAAEDVDPATGDLLRFQLLSGPMLVSAASARIVVDAERDAFGFELTDVVFTRVPERGEPGRSGALHALDRYRLGPAPFGADIVEDGAARLGTAR